MNLVRTESNLCCTPKSGLVCKLFRVWLQHLQMHPYLPDEIGSSVTASRQCQGLTQHFVDRPV